ncbi:MAG TPA: hypothetical protein VGR35_06100 [Tepidisphaeraceae bacterium]|nr:hypothetical protein [Tepidisphaeraceae bacterium]
MMRAAERLRVAIATATNTRAENDAETAKMKARVRDSIAKGLVKIDGDEVTLTHAAPDTGEGAPGEQITMSARRVDGQWKLDVLRGVRSQEPAARAQTIHYMRMNAKAQDAVAAQFREGKVKNAAAVDYLVRMEMMRLEAEESVRKPAPATKAASRPIEKKAEVKRDERPPKAAASDPLGRGEIRRILTDGRVAAIALSPDGALLASGARLAEQPLRLWDVQTGELVRTFAMPAGLAVQVNDVMWTNDEKHVITCGRTFKDAERGARCRSRVARG